jgi:ABC-type lipoprotein release transport system permease subunit
VSRSGASAAAVLFAVFRRPLAQVGTGVIVGVYLAYNLARSYADGLTGREAGAVAGYAAFMLGACVLACIVPVRRALAIEPTDALRDDG